MKWLSLEDKCLLCEVLSFKTRHLEQFCHFGPFLCHLRHVIHHNFVILEHFYITLDQYVTFHITLDIVSKDTFLVVCEFYKFLELGFDFHSINSY